MIKTIKTLLLVTTLISAPAWAEDTGSYLSLRHAFFHSDDAAVARFVDKELSQNPDDVRMLEQAIISDVYYDDLADAYERAQALEEQGYTNLYTDLAKFGYLVQQGEFEKLADQIGTDGALEFLDASILYAWQAAVDGNLDQAVAILNEAAKDNPDTKALLDYQRALILGFGGEYADAAAILDGDGEPLYLSNDSFYAHVMLKILAGDDSWHALVQETYGDEENQTHLLRTIIDAAQNNDIPKTASFASPQNAIAEYLRFVLTSGDNDDTDSYVQRYFVTLLPAMAPDHDGMVVNALGFFDRSDESDDLLLFADKIDDKSPYRLIRDNYASDNNYFLENDDAALQIVKDAPEDTIDALNYKANSYRILDLYDRALEYYDRAIALTGDDPASWNLYYGRAIALDRLDDWPTARASLERAIELSPDNPEILNYLGYSLVDRAEDVERGLELINQAVDIAPERGHILDSLGWAYYRLGRYEDALDPLEQASFLRGTATEPVVYSHLGDLYWQLGRKREARYMWERALVFITEDTVDTSVDEIQARLDAGAPPQS